MPGACGPYLPLTFNTWFLFSHRVLLSRSELYALHIRPSPQCVQCGQYEDFYHMLTRCKKLNGCVLTLWGWINLIEHRIDMQRDLLYLFAHYTSLPLNVMRRKFFVWLIATTIHFLLNEVQWTTVAEYKIYMRQQLGIWAPSVGLELARYIRILI